MASTFYIDESGNTGDLAGADAALGFDGQRVFALAALGIDCIDALADELSQLRRRYRVQAAELKFASVRSKPGLLADLVHYLEANRIPIMVELVDKRFQLCFYVVECLIVPAKSAAEFEEGPLAVKNAFADILLEHAPDYVLHAFARACAKGTKDALEEAFVSLLVWLDRLPQVYLVAAMQRLTTMSFAEFREEAKDDPQTLAGYRPDPDKTKSGKPVWILPHITSLSNLYARINCFRQRRLAGVSIFHDEQMQFDEALKQIKAQCEIAKGMPRLGVADFSFEEAASLTFISSHDNPGIQAADLIAGMSAFCLRQFLSDPAGLSQDWARAFEGLIRQTSDVEGRGVNLVTSMNVAHGMVHLCGAY